MGKPSAAYLSACLHACAPTSSQIMDRLWPITLVIRAGAQPVKTPTASTYHHLQFSGSGAKTAAAGLTVNGDLTFSVSATFTAGAFTHNFAGNWIVDTTAAAPLSVATTSVINFNAPAMPAATSMGGATA